METTQTVMMWIGIITTAYFLGTFLGDVGFDFCNAIVTKEQVDD